ncbi:MAG: cyclophilin-like fold protein [Desulfoferrobacter sp.]
MARSIRITAGQISMQGELNDSPTAAAIESALPIEATARTWGDEIYFPIPVKQRLDDTAAEVVEIGDLGYWPSGRAFCIFFGPTPASRGDEIRPASAVNVVGRVAGDARALKVVADGELVRIEKVP